MKLRFKPHPKPGAHHPGMQSRSRNARDSSKIQPRPKTKPAPRALKSQPGYIRCMFTLTLSEYRIIQICMEERGLEAGSYNAALQTILREWKVLKDQKHHPALIAVPADMLPSKYELGEE